MSKIVFSTVGTSIFTNIAKEEDNFSKMFKDYINGNEDEDKIKEYVNKKIYKKQDNDTTSAEIKSLNKIGIEEDDILYFIVTDTNESKLSGNILAKYFNENYGVKSEVMSIPNLVVNDSKKFEREGIKNLIEKLINIIEKNPYAEIIFNPTGGYKGVVPYLTILGMLYNKKIAYIFENTNNLIELPPIPLEFNYDIINEHEEKFEKLFNDAVLDVEDFFAGIEFSLRSKYDPFLIIEDGKVILSALGEMVYRKYRLLNEKKFIKLSKNAMKKFESIEDKNTKEKIISLLKKLLNKDLRENNLHEKFEKGTDCYVLKIPATGERIFYYLDGDEPKICEIVPNHDDYIFELNNKGVYKENYKQLQFEELYLED